MGIQFDGINNEIKSQTKIDFPGSVGVAGTLTYEDVANVDSVGLITARTGIKIGPTAGVAGTFFADGSYITAGVVTATTFHGSGANLTSLPAQATIANNADNRVITGGSGVNLNGEANLTFDGTSLLTVHVPSATGEPAINFTNSDTGTGTGNGFGLGLNSSESPYIWNRENTDLRIGTNNTERVRIDSSGRILIGTTTEGSTVTGDDFTLNRASGNCGITIRTNNSSTGSLVFSDGTSGTAEYAGFVQYQHSGDLLVLGNAGGERLHIRSDGRTQIKSGDFEVIGGEGGNAEIRLTADEGDDGADYWRFQSNASSNKLNIATYASGSWVDKITINTDGNVGINAANPNAKLLIIDDSATETNILKLRNYKSGVNTKPTLVFEASTSAGQGANSSIQGLAGTDAGGANNANESGMKFIVRYGGSGTVREAFTIKKDGNVYFPAGQGIDFSATSDATGMTSELFSDYERGVHTFSVMGSGGNPTVSIQNNYHRLYYTKIGDMVHVTGEMRWTISSHGSGDLKISLPFTADSSAQSNCQGTAQTWNVNWAYRSESRDLWSEVSPGNNYMRFRIGGSNSLNEDYLDCGSSYQKTSNSNYGVEYQVSLWYRTG